MSSKTLPHDVEELALRYFEGLDNPRALSMAILLRYGEWDTFARMQVDPSHFLFADDYGRAAAATAFLRKCVDLPTTFDRTQAAVDNWWAGEISCYKSNERLAPYLDTRKVYITPRKGDVTDRCGPASLGWVGEREPDIAEFFRRVRNRVEGWIGKGPKTLTGMRFGPGTTLSDKGRFITVPDKLTSIPTLTRDAIWYLPQWADSKWGRHCAAKSRNPVFMRGNKFSTAPKDATKERAIATEPAINVVFQLGLNEELCDLLKFAEAPEIRAFHKRAGRVIVRASKGVDIQNGKFIHMRRAMMASSSGASATLDATNASDSVCYNLVKLATPTRWFGCLAALRSVFTLMPGKAGERDRWVRLEKFSSMGNGFTFPLETIIFAALCCEALASVGLPHTLGKDVYVYGDDMIVPSDGVRVVTAVLAFCGVSLNREKSFSDGNFRESCGGDYFNGSLVRPFYLKEFPREPSDWIAIANGLNRQSWSLGLDTPGLGPLVDPSQAPDGLSPQGAPFTLRAWHYAVSRLPRSIARCRGPRDLGDIVINDLERRWQLRSSKICSQSRQIYVWKPVKLRVVSFGAFHPDVVLASVTYGAGDSNIGRVERDVSRDTELEPLSGRGVGGVTPRDAVLSYGHAWTACP